MAMKQFTITKNDKLTHDVFEIHFKTEEPISMNYGQFVTFILPEIGGRSYSVLEENGTTIKLIIKKVELEDSGRWGSIFICDSKVWDTLQGVGPAGHFVLQKNNKNKLFIGTGTGLVPLYNQAVWAVEEGWCLWRKTERTLNFRGKYIFWKIYLESINGIFKGQMSHA